MSSLEEVMKSLESIEDTIFDSPEFDVSINPALSGGPLRDRIAEIQNIQSNINRLAAKAITLEMKYKMRVKEAEDLASAIIVADAEKSKAKGNLKSYYLYNQKVKLRGEENQTSLLEEEYISHLYTYLAIRAKDKVRETNSAIDLGRSLLSWDKEELSHMGG